MKKLLNLTFMLIASFQVLNAQQEDPFLWLEDVDSEKSMEWVKEQNARTMEVFSKQPNYQTVYSKTLEMLNSSDRIASPSITGNYIYNFWQDKEHVRGIWRRCAKVDYINGSPNWEILLDIDKLCVDENQKWVFKGASGLYPNYERFMVSLSKGGGDAVEVREFDMATKSFNQNGFFVPESKGGVSWFDENTLLISSNFGEGTMTTSGYPRQVKMWTRGTNLTDAVLIYEGKSTDMSIGGSVMRDGATKYILISNAQTFYSKQDFIYKDGSLFQLKLPHDADIEDILNNQLIVSLKSDWSISGKVFKQGSIISLNFTSFINGKEEVVLVAEPDKLSSISAVASTKNHLMITVLNNVKNELYIYTFKASEWKKVKVNAPDFGVISLSSVDDQSDDYFFYFQNFLTPSSLYFANSDNNTLKVLKSMPSFFDASKMQVTQFKVKSSDGTLIPYFVVSSKDVKYDGKNPTLLYAYGGFEVSSLPTYSGTIGMAWLEQGGVYVLANIRGGGEFGPKWHQAGLKEKRQLVYDDFHSVAQDLIAKKITSKEHLGIYGGSNGGLLVGVAFTERPDLYKAVVCAVPLLDMKRYNKLLAGASWMGEYGNPDIPEEWAYIQKYSPYQNLKIGERYPQVYFTTSTRDDRVHPGHARKMAAKMLSMGNKIYYFENIEGGHGGSSTNDQRARAAALQYAYLWMKLK